MDNRIKELRKKKKLSQAKLAEAINTTDVQISRLENGQRELTQRWMVRIATTLGCDPSDLITDSGTPTLDSSFNGEVMKNCIVRMLDVAAEETQLTGEILEPQEIARLTVALYAEHMTWLAKHSHEPNTNERIEAQASNIVSLAKVLKD